MNELGIIEDQIGDSREDFAQETGFFAVPQNCP